MAKTAAGTYHLRPAGSGLALAPSNSTVRALIGDFYFIHVYSDVDVHIKFGDITVEAAADTTSLQIKGATPYIFPVSPGEYIAAYKLTDAAAVQVHYME